MRWAVAILVLLACSVWIDVAHVLDELSRISLAWVALILAVITVDRLLMAWKWSVLLKALGVRVPLPMLCRVYYQTSFASALLPSGIGGDLLRAHLVGRASAMPAEVYASIAMERGLGFLSAANWAAIGAVIVAVWRAGEVPCGWVAGLGLAVVACNATFLFSLTPRFHARVLQRTARLGQRRFLGSLHHLYLAHSQYSRAKGALARYAALTLGEHLIQMFWMLLTAMSLGWEVEPFVFLAATAVQLMLYRIPISPDGWGVGELTAIGVYGLLGIAPARAFSLALLEHALRVVAVTPGLWFLVRTSRFERGPDSHGR